MMTGSFWLGLLEQNTRIGSSCTDYADLGLLEPIRGVIRGMNGYATGSYTIKNLKKGDVRSAYHNQLGRAYAHFCCLSQVNLLYLIVAHSKSLKTDGERRKERRSSNVSKNRHLWRRHSFPKSGSSNRQSSIGYGWKTGASDDDRYYFRNAYTHIKKWIHSLDVSPLIEPVM